ncbi:MAG TPA: hypothetical protein VEF53_18625 [Patescibacteria group bacterium]|nr:hypothetical protein [Patescibacteria group bacterium]
MDKTVKELLISYRHNKSRVEVLNVRIDELNKQIEYNKKMFIEDEHEAIEGLATPAALIDDMPKSITNLNSDPTSRIAIAYAKDLVCTNEIDLLDAKIEIAEKKEEKERLDTEIKLVDALLTSLSAEQKLVVDKFYIEGMIWRYVGKEYEKKFGEFRHNETLKEIRDCAILEMENVKAGV